MSSDGSISIFRLSLEHISTILGLGLGFLMIARVLRQNLRPSVSLSWLMAIILIPYVGVPAYILFGGRKLTWWAGKKKALYDPPAQAPFSEIITPSRVEDVLIAAGMPQAKMSPSPVFIADGQAAYRELLAMINRAQCQIQIMTFILGRDDVGRALIDALSRKASEGVEVRLLLDALGCVLTRGRFSDPLRKAGGKIGIFMPVLPVRPRSSANLRNHRKMAIIDGKEAMIGGMNLTGNYMGPEANPGRWIDTMSKITGPAVSDLASIFESDWNFATGETLQIDCPAEGPESKGDSILQVAASGPDVQGEPLYEALLTACFEAEKRAWIVTPYFVPDEGLLRALLLQARLGHDVRIVLPARSNHSLADIARGRFLRQLVDAGARLYLHRDHMIHAKHALFDDSVAMAGSANLDMRSLYLNYELALFFHSPEEVRAIASWMEELMTRSELVSGEELKAGYVRQWAEDLSLLVSPLL